MHSAFHKNLTRHWSFNSEFHLVTLSAMSKFINTYPLAIN